MLTMEDRDRDAFDGTKGLPAPECDADCVSMRYVSSTSVETPGPFDVVLGRGRWYAMHTGNKRLQTIINCHLERYQSAPIRKTKTSITHEILDQIKDCPVNPGRFLRHDKKLNGWVPVDDDTARLKISQAMRYSIRTPTADKQQDQQYSVPSNRQRKRSSMSSSGSGSSSDREPRLKRHLSLRSSFTSDPVSLASSEQSMLPSQQRPILVASLPIGEAALPHLPPQPYAPVPASQEEVADEILLTDEDIYIALGYGPNPFG